ncbi:MAG: hypothetical protein ABFD89_25215 [Bryobacteraceae bacterium]
MSANVLLSLALCVAIGSIPRAALAADVESPKDITKAKAMALHVCAVLQEQAERRESSGHSAGSAARAFAVKAGLSDTETEAMLGVAARMRSRVQPLDDRARAIIQAAKQKYPGGLLPPGTSPPPLPPELVELQRQRDSIVAEAVRELDGELKPAGLAKLHTYLSEKMLQKRLRTLPVQTPNEIGPPGEPAQVDSRRKETAR